VDHREAEAQLFKEIVRFSERQSFGNIFKLLFHWEFHRQVMNWKNLVQFHMAHAKQVKPGKGWIGRLYRGITEAEVSLLEKIYDYVQPVSAQTIRESYLSLVSREGRAICSKSTPFLQRTGSSSSTQRKRSPRIVLGGLLPYECTRERALCTTIRAFLEVMSRVSRRHFSCETT